MATQLRGFRALGIAGFAALTITLVSACNGNGAFTVTDNSNGSGSIGTNTASSTASGSGSKATTYAHSTPVGSGGSTGRPTSPASMPATSFTHVPMQTATGGEFVTPSDNISCEVEYQMAGVPDHAYCETIAPARSVTMDVTGTYKTCTGQQCLGNAGAGTPTVAYGTETGVGPFQCESATTGVTCIVGGRGFHISASGITSAG